MGIRRVALVEDRVADGPAARVRSGKGRPADRRRRGPCRRRCEHDADGTANPARASPAARAADSMRRRARTSRSSNRPVATIPPAVRRWPGRRPADWRRPRGRAQPGSDGTSRQVGAGSRSAIERRLDQLARGGRAPVAERAGTARPRPAGRRCPARSRASDARLEREQDAGAVARRAIGGEGTAMAERRRGPASASGSTRDRDRPPASATNPTPHASCSKRGS